LVGVGRGWTMEEAFDKAVADLRHPVTKIKVNQET
jgi:prefoldin subunit 5